MPGTMPATSQLDWLISITAMIVLFWSRATRDLLKSFGWGIAALHRLHAATKLPSLAARPIASIGPPPEIVVDPSGSRRDHRAKCGCLSASPRVRCLGPPGKTQHLLPKSVFDRPGSDRWNLASTTFPDAGPMVRIRFPPALSPLRRSFSGGKRG